MLVPNVSSLSALTGHVSHVMLDRGDDQRIGIGIVFDSCRSVPPAEAACIIGTDVADAEQRQRHVSSHTNPFGDHLEFIVTDGVKTSMTLDFSAAGLRARCCSAPGRPRREARSCSSVTARRIDLDLVYPNRRHATRIGLGNNDQLFPAVVLHRERAHGAGLHDRTGLLVRPFLRCLAGNG